MKYKISNLYIRINDESIPVGVVLGEEDKPESPYSTDSITISEYEEGLKNFTYGSQRIHDCVYHYLGRYYTTGEPKPIKRKWVEELKRLGYDVSKVQFAIEE
jgi:hypothetical protein